MEPDRLEKFGFLAANSIHSLLSYWDKDLVCRYANHAFIEWFGIHPDKIIDKMTLEDILIPEYFQSNNPYFNKVLKGYTQEYEWELILPNDEIRNTLVTLTPDSKDKETKGFFYYLKDITTIKKLQTSEIQLKKVTQAVEQSSASILITNIKGDIEYVNPAFTKLTGYSKKEVIGQNPRILKTGHTTESIYKEMWQTLLNKKEWIGEFYNRKKNGDTYWESVNISPIINDNDEITSFVAVKENITVRKKLEKEMKQINSELRAFANHLQNISEIEKNKIALEMHDKLGQGLIALKMEAQHIKKNLNEDKFSLEKKLDNLLIAINDKVEAFRNIYDSVNPAMLQELGLLATIEHEKESFERSCAIRIKFLSNVKDGQLNESVSLALLRIIQEGLSNIKLNSKAKKCSISLMYRSNTLYLDIEDDGCGFEPSKVDSKFHHGIIGMRERAYAVNGKFHIHSVIEKGTHIKVEIPFVL